MVGVYYEKSIMVQITISNCILAVYLNILFNAYTCCQWLAKSNIYLQHCSPWCKLIRWWSSFISYTQAIRLLSASSKFDFIATPGSCNRARPHHIQSSLLLIRQQTVRRDCRTGLRIKVGSRRPALPTSLSQPFCVHYTRCVVQHTDRIWQQTVVGHRKRVGAGGPIWIPHRFEVTDNHTRTGKTSSPSAPCALVRRQAPRFVTMRAELNI